MRPHAEYICPVLEGRGVLAYGVAQRICAHYFVNFGKLGGYCFAVRVGFPCGVFYRNPREGVGAHGGFGVKVGYREVDGVGRVAHPVIDAGGAAHAPYGRVGVVHSHNAYFWLDFAYVCGVVYAGVVLSARVVYGLKAKVAGGLLYNINKGSVGLGGYGHPGIGAAVPYHKHKARKPFVAGLPGEGVLHIGVCPLVGVVGLDGHGGIGAVNRCGRYDKLGDNGVYTDIKTPADVLCRRGVGNVAYIKLDFAHKALVENGNADIFVLAGLQYVGNIEGDEGYAFVQRVEEHRIPLGRIEAFRLKYNLSVYPLGVGDIGIINGLDAFMYVISGKPGNAEVCRAVAAVEQHIYEVGADIVVIITHAVRVFYEGAEIKITREQAPEAAADDIAEV